MNKQHYLVFDGCDSYLHCRDGDFTDIEHTSKGGMVTRVHHNSKGYDAFSVSPIDRASVSVDGELDYEGALTTWDAAHGERWWRQS